MVSKKSKIKLKKPHDNISHTPTTINIFKTLISALESHKGIKTQLLKSAYYLLTQLSLKQQLSLGKGTDLNELFMKTTDGEVRVSLRDLNTLSNILFKDLQRKLKHLQSLKHDELTSQSLELQELNLILRCCMVTLTFQLPQEHHFEKGRFFLLIFKKLCLLQACDGNSDLKKSGSCQCMCIGEISSDSFADVASLSSLNLFDPCIPSVTTILEVFIDELLVHGRVKKHLQIIHSFFCPTKESLFKHGPNGGEFGIIMELICSHFSLSLSSEGRFRDFLDKLTWARLDNPKSLELSITAMRNLLQNPVLLSSPKLLQAHFVSLLSNVINPDIITKMPLQDPRLIHHYLSVFESSVTMYTQHMSILKTYNHSEDSKGNFVILQNETSLPSFESCIDSRKREKLDETITTLNESWNLNLRKKFFKTKSNLLTSSIKYIDQIAPSILDESHKDDILSFLKSMLTKASNEDNNIELSLNGDESLQDICLLASLLMLMSNSLIQSIWCIKHHSDQPGPTEYDFIVGIIKCFKDFSIRLPIQKFSYNIMENCNESRLMIIHFLGLLSLSFDSGLDFLVKSCISVIMALTNLFVFEEGNINGLKLLSNSQSLSSERSLTVYEKPLAVAKKFQKIKTLYVSNSSTLNCSTPTQDLEPNPISMEHVANEETCSGEMYLKPRLSGSGKVEDFDDLADFVECKKGKDYVGWLKDRDKFRKRKIVTRAKRMWDKKREAWRSMRGKN